MVNSVVITGRLTRDPELRTTSTGKSVTSFSVAVQKRIKPQDGSPDTDFFNVTCWGATADFVTQYLTKGRLIAVEGRLQSRKYTTNDGSQREVVEIVANQVTSLERPREDGQQGTAEPARSNPAQTTSTPAADEYDPFADE
jgi:single-strand DNA-binding protein